MIAANVLHATRDIDATVANVRALCRKGGVLLINGEFGERIARQATRFGLEPRTRQRSALVG